MRRLRARAMDEANAAKASCDRATLDYLMDAAVREELDLLAISLFDI